MVKRIEIVKLRITTCMKRMQLKSIIAIAALLLVVASLSVAGCTTSNTPTATPTETPTAQGVQATHLTLVSSNSSPAKNQNFTLFGYLNDSNNAGLGKKPINVYYHLAGETNWTYWTTVVTNKTGYYSLSDRENQTEVAYCKAAFPGDNSYAASSAEVIVTIK